MFKPNSYALLFLSAFLFPAIEIKAEGTKEVSPSSSNVASLYYSPTNYGSYFNCPEDNRINFVIKDHVAENLYFGFRWVTRGNATLVNNMYFRIKNSAGVVVAGPTLCPIAGNGLIGTYNQAILGPNIAGSAPGGYAPISFNPTSNDTYYIEIYRSGNGGVSQTSTTSAIAPFFDFTVATTTGVRSSGRVFAKKWGFVAGNPGDNYNGATTDDVSPSFYTYSGDSTVVNVVFDRFNPLAFNVAFNNYGVNPLQTDFAIGRRSVYSANNPDLSGSFNTFLNVPDVTIFPTSPAPLPPTAGRLYGCPGFYYLPYRTYAHGDVRILLDLNGVAGYQENTADIYLFEYDVPAGLNTATWNGLDGLGNQVSVNAPVNVQLTSLRGRTNMPLYDPEYNLYGFTLNAIAPTPVSNLKMFWDDSQLTVVTGQGANNNNTTGAGIANISTGQVSPGHAWNGNYGPTLITTFPAPSIGGTGNATVGNLDDDFGNVRIINTWFWPVEVSGTAFALTIPNCTPAPDFNITFVNVQVDGNVSANDDVAVGSTYGTPTAVPGNPGPAIPVMNANGGYVFTSSVPGVFQFDVPVCAPAAVPPCPNVLLTITVLDNAVVINPPVANIDIATTNMDVPVSLHTLGNDQAGNPGGILTPASVTILTAPSNGNAVVNPLTGDITYTPSSGFTGQDTLAYTVCDNSSPVPLCANSIQIITVQGVCDCTINTVTPNDDYSYTPFNTAVTGNVLTNDTDPEGDAIAVNPVTTTEPGIGTVVINSNGSWTFTPVSGYTGPVDFYYTVCDNAIPQACAQATLHILVGPPLYDPNPDFNVTYVNVTVTGNVNTNDHVESGSSYGTPISLPGNPGPAVPVMNADGTYSFTSAVAGVFLFDVPVCSPSQVPPCPNVLLTITVLDNTVLVNPPVANIDIATTHINIPVTLNTLANDEAGNTGGSLVPGSVTITQNPSNGSASVNASTGEITYTPSNGFIGTDTLNYNVCDNSNPVALCATSIQVITILPFGSANSTAAADDYASTPFETQVTGNVILNDNDAEGDSQAITPQNTTVTGSGTLVLNGDGTWTFTPETGFTGPVEFPYTVCDDATIQACTNATLHIIVQPQSLVPLTLLDFRATYANGSVKLVWDVTNENGVNRHHIERSFNGNRYELIGSVAAHNTGSSDRYTYYDDLRGVRSNILYYRLRSDDVSGLQKYSPVAVVRLGTNGQVIVSPNPATNQVQLSFYSESTSRGTVQLYGSNGQLHHQEPFVARVSGNQLITLTNLDRFETGVYLLKVRVGGEVFTQKFVITH